MARRKKRIDNKRHVEDLARSLTRRGPGDEEHAPTPERVAKAKVAGAAVRANVIHNEAGFATSEYYWQITPVIDELKRRGTILQEEWDVACRYMRHYAGSRHKGPATSKLLPSYDSGFRDMEPAERAMAMGQARANAESFVYSISFTNGRPNGVKDYRYCLRWLEKAAEDDVPLWYIGAHYYPRATQSYQSARAPGILQEALSILAAHYGRSGRFTIRDIESAVRTFRMTKTVVEIEERIPLVNTFGESW